MARKDPQDQSLSQLGDSCGDPGPGATGMMKECFRLCGVPLAWLSPADWRLLVGQGIGLKWLVPMTLELLEHDPLVATDYYPGDLLLNLLRARLPANDADSRRRLEACLAAAAERLTDDDDALRRDLREAATAAGLTLPPGW
jgi:hypothetical protein